jgi:predicted flap endonuclease-1-like 5' DNA nuclease
MADPETAAEPGTPATNDAVAELHDGESRSLRDNLRLIKGIGPTIEKTLNELGIFRYHQIAEMSEYDIDRVARRLKGFSTRIYREDWIGQARNLQLQQSGT